MGSRRVIKVEETDRLPPAGADSCTPEGLFTQNESENGGESKKKILKSVRDQRKFQTSQKMFPFTPSESGKNFHFRLVWMDLGMSKYR